MAILDEIISGKAEKFDALREVSVDDGARILLLTKRGFQGTGYFVVLELRKGWYFYFSEYFNTFKLQYATTEPGFKRVARTVTHIGYAEDGGKFTIYHIPPDNRIVIEPNGAKPFYQFFCRVSDPIEEVVFP
ncbi:MAG TPA: hypothetical protein VNI84_13855 [Pyrinomonadaceae bacterium]|nr:hypothetical protein [Pyrinomonadaceae bacterium]